MFSSFFYVFFDKVLHSKGLNCHPALNHGSVMHFNSWLVTSKVTWTTVTCLPHHDRVSPCFFGQHHVSEMTSHLLWEVRKCWGHLWISHNISSHPFDALRSCCLVWCTNQQLQTVYNSIWRGRIVLGQWIKRFMGHFSRMCTLTSSTEALFDWTRSISLFTSKTSYFISDFTSRSETKPAETTRHHGSRL